MATTTNPETRRPEATPDPSPPPRVRRRPGLIALGIALTALGAWLAAWLVGSVTDTKAVIAIVEGVDRGSVITEESLGETKLNADSDLATVPVSETDSVVGKTAAADLTPGGVLTPGSFTDAAVPTAGTALVNVAVAPAQLPTQQLRSGQAIRVVNTPRPQDDSGKGEQPTISAIVVSSQFDEDSGNYGVDVTVPADQASELAAWVATGRVAIVVDSEAGR